MHPHALEADPPGGQQYPPQVWSLDTPSPYVNQGDAGDATWLCGHGRSSRPRSTHRALLVAPSESFVASLPGGRIPERRDCYRFPDAERITRWQAVLDATERLGDEMRELVVTGRIAEVAEAW